MELENKKIIERILEMPLVSHLENYAQSGFTEIYMKDLLNNSYKSKCLEEDILEAEKELLEEFPNPVGGRYCLFEFTLDAPWFLGDNKLGEIFPQLKTKELYNGEVTTLKKYLLRYSQYLSHLGIAGSFVQELYKQFPDYLKFMDIKFYQTDHGEAPTLVFTKDFALKMVGGGRLSILPDAKTINFYGKSKTFPNYLSGNPNQSFDEINSELGFNTFAQQIVKDYLKEKGIGYKTKVECG